MDWTPVHIPKFTFIVPSYKPGMAVARCLDSITAQTDPDYEVIVVNDGRNDEMRKIVETAVPKSTYIEYPYVGRAGGFAGIDIGIDMAVGHFIYILNGDNEIRPDFVQKMYNPDAHILICQVLMNDMPGIILHGKSWNKGRIDRANYAIASGIAKEVKYRDFSMQQDDWHFFIACQQLASSKGPVRVHDVDEVLTIHN